MRDILISDFTEPNFQNAFKAYFNELGVSIDSWDVLFKEMNDDEDNSAYVRIDDSGVVVGFIQFKASALSNWFFNMPFGFIREFWVSKQYRNKGCGKELLKLAEDYFKLNGLHKAILTTDTAPAFYEKQGYVKDTGIAAKNDDEVFVKVLF